MNKNQALNVYQRIIRKAKPIPIIIRKAKPIIRIATPIIVRKAKSKIIRKAKFPLIIVQKSPSEEREEFLKWISTEAGFIEMNTESVNEDGFLAPTELYHYQKRFLNSSYRFEWDEKSRQIGMSYTYACRAFARAMLRDNYLCIFVSFNEDEAKEKIRYCNELWHTLPKNGN